MKIFKQILKSKAFYAFTIVFCAMVHQAKAGTTTWTGAQDTLWSNANNWSTSGGSTPPASGDDVVITIQTFEPTFNVSGGATINSLTVNSSSTLKLDGTNALTVSGNTSVGSGGLLMTRRSTFTTVTISGSGELSVFGATTHIKGDLAISTYSSYSYAGTQSYMIFDGIGPQNIGGCLAGSGGLDFNINGTNIEIANQYYPVTTTGDIQFNIMTIDAGAEFKPGASNKVHADNEIENILVYGTIDVTYCNVTASTDDPQGQYLYGFNTSYAVVQYFNQGTLKFAGTSQQEETTTHGTGNKQPINIEIANTSDTVRFTVSQAATNNLTIDAGTVLRVGASYTVTAANIIVNGTARVSMVSNTSDGFAEQFIATSSYTLTNATLDFQGASAQKLGDHNFKNLIVNTASGGLTLTGASGLTISGNITGTGAIYGGSDNITVDGTFSVSTFTANSSTIILGNTGSSNLGAYTFNNLTINSGTVTLTGSIIVNGNLAGSGTLIPGSYNVTVYGNTTINSITTGTGTTTISGTSPGINAQTFYNLTISNTTATLSGNITVNHILTLTSGKINLGAYKLTIANGGSISGYSSTDYIFTNGSGTLEMTVTTAGATFYIGDGYNPITITPSGTATFDIAVSNGITENDGSTQVPDYSVNRTWTISCPGTSTSVTVTPQWNNSTDLCAGGHYDLKHAFVAYRDITHTNIWTPSTSYYDISLEPDPTQYTVSSGPGLISITMGDQYNIGVGLGSASALPVTFLDFNAILNTDNTVLLNWETASEINNDYFGIERSTDGAFWQTIGQIPGHGNSQVTESYSFSDNLPGVIPSDVIYYRLKQVDFNQKFEYSEIRAVNIETNSLSLEMYPNPAGNALNLNWTNQDNSPVILKLINTTGSTIYTQNVSGKGLKNNQIDLSNFASGTYFLQIVSDKDVISKMVYKE